MSKTITLTLTEEHAQTVQDACEMLMRMKLGQTAMPTEFMMGWPTILENKDEIDHYCDMRVVAERALSAFILATGYKAGTPKDKTEQMAYEIWARSDTRCIWPTEAIRTAGAPPHMNRSARAGWTCRSVR